MLQVSDLKSRLFAPSLYFHIHDYLQLHKIHAVLGTPPERILSKFYPHRNRQIPWEFPEVIIDEYFTFAICWVFVKINSEVFEPTPKTFNNLLHEYEHFKINKILSSEEHFAEKMTNLYFSLCYE